VTGDGENTCGVGSHSAKAKLTGNSFYAKTKMKGGSRALSTKTICVEHMRIEDMPCFVEARHAPSDWESKFDRAKFLKHAGGPFMTIEKSDDKSSMMDLESNLPDCMPTQKRQRSSAAEESDPGWKSLPWKRSRPSGRSEL
jgi:hypothetical protein